MLILFTLFLHLFTLQTDLSNQLQEQINRTDTEKKMQENPKNIESLVDLAYSYLTKNPDSSISIGKEALYYSTKYNLIDEQIESHRTIGYAYSILGNYSDAFSHFTSAEQIAVKANYKKGLAKVYNNFAIANKNIGRYEEAMNYNFKSVTLKKELKDTIGLANSYGNIAILYKNLNDYTSASHYFNLALSLFKEIGNEEKVATTLGNIAAVKISEFKLDSALVLYDEALEVLKNSPMTQNIAQLLSDKARVLIQKGHSEDAKLVFTKALEHFESTKDYYGATTAYIGLADLSKFENQNKKALEFGEQALKTALTANNRKQLSEVYKLLAELYAQLANYTKAYTYQKLYQVESDSLLITQSLSKIAQLAAEYSIREREKELELAYAKEHSFIQNVVVVIGILLIAITLILVTILISRQKLRKAYTTISIVNKEIASLNDTLNLKVQERTEKLEKLNRQLKQFAFSTNHQLRRPLANILGFIEILTHTDTTDSEYKEILEQLKSESLSLDKIIKNMNVDLHRYDSIE